MEKIKSRFKNLAITLEKHSIKSPNYILNIILAQISISRSLEMFERELKKENNFFKIARVSLNYTHNYAMLQHTDNILADRMIAYHPDNVLNDFDLEDSFLLSSV